MPYNHKVYFLLPEKHTGNNIFFYERKFFNVKVDICSSILSAYAFNPHLLITKKYTFYCRSIISGISILEFSPDK